MLVGGLDPGDWELTVSSGSGSVTSSALLVTLPEPIEDVKLISVQVNDPGHEPFVAHLPMTWPVDLPAPLRGNDQAIRAGVGP